MEADLESALEQAHGMLVNLAFSVIPECNVLDLSTRTSGPS
jgi:hypothetical protein